MISFVFEFQVWLTILVGSNPISLIQVVSLVVSLESVVIYCVKSVVVYCVESVVIYVVGRYWGLRIVTCGAYWGFGN